MPFNKQTMNYATQYASYLAQAFPYVLFFGALYATPNNGRFKFVNGNSIAIPHISTAGRRNSDSDGAGNKARRYNNTYTTLTLRNHREWETLVHPHDINATNGAASIQNITQVYNNEQKFPEMDAYTASRLFADWKLAGKAPYTDTLTKDNILAIFDKMMERATEKRVPNVGRYLYVTPDVETLLKNAIENRRNLGAGSAANIDRAVSNLDKVTIVTVPSELMLTAYDFTEGFEPGATAKQIKMFLVHPQAVITPVAYEFAKLDEPSAGSGGKYDYFEESYEDAFILPYKEGALDFVIEPVVIDSLTFATAASTESGAVAGDCVITVSTAKQNPANKLFYKVASETAPTAPISGEEIAGKGYTEFTSGEVADGITNGYKITIVEVNADGRAVAAGSGTVTSKT